MRVRLWTKEDSLYGRTNAMEVVKRAIRAGLNPYLVLFLSDDWADLMKQPAPAKWKGLSLAERATAIQAYSRDIVTHFRKAGLRSHLYGIGNEIDFGVCGEYPGQESEKAVNSLREHVWPRAAKLILASERVSRRLIQRRGSCSISPIGGMRISASLSTASCWIKVCRLTMRDCPTTHPPTWEEA